VVVPIVQFADREQALRAIPPVLADSNQNSGREGHVQFAGVFQGPQPLAGHLAPRTGVGPNFRGRLEHHAHAGVDVRDGRQLLAGLIARIGVREESSSSATSQASRR